MSSNIPMSRTRRGDGGGGEREHLLESDNDDSSGEATTVVSPRGNSFIYKLTSIASIGGFLFGYDTGVVSGAILLIKADPDFDMSTLEVEFVVSVTVGVACLFALIGGWLNRSIGRKLTIIISSVFFILGSAILGLARSYTELLIGRAVVGAGLGIASMSVPIYLAECAPTEYRGAIITVNNLSITGGQLIAALVCALLANVSEGWRWMLALAAFPAALQLVGFVFILPESPRYLLEMGKSYAARETLQRIRGGGVDEELEYMERNIRDSQRANNAGSGLFTTGNGRHALVIGCMLQLFQQFTGINTVMYYSATIIYMSGLVTDPGAAVWFAALTASMNFIFTLVGLWSIERFGRRKLVLASLSGCILSLLVLSGGFFWSQKIEDQVTTKRSDSVCASEYMNEGCSKCIQGGCAFCFADGIGSCDGVDYNSTTYQCASHTINETLFWSDSFCPKTQASWLPIAGMMLYLATFAPGMGPVPWAVNAEIYPNKAREMGMAVSTGVNWAANCLVSLTFLSLLEALGSWGGFLFYAGQGVLALFLFSLLLPETKGVSLDDMDKLLSRGWIQIGRKAEDEEPIVDDSE